jgi:hypothetical protein
VPEPEIDDIGRQIALLGDRATLPRPLRDYPPQVLLWEHLGRNPDSRDECLLAEALLSMGGVAVQAEHARELGNQRLADLLDLPKRIFAKSATRTVVAFDEFQDFLRIGEGLDGLLRSKIQLHRDEASYVFAGSEPGMLDELFNRKGRPLFDQARPIPLGPLDGDDLAEHIGTRFERSARDPGVALDLLVDLARGHPQRAMLLAHHLWEHTPRGQAADEETWQSASNNAVPPGDTPRIAQAPRLWHSSGVIT